jgi:hypothetical protein
MHRRRDARNAREERRGRSAARSLLSRRLAWAQHGRSDQPRPRSPSQRRPSQSPGGSSDPPRCRRRPVGVAVLLTVIGAQPANQVLGHGVDHARRRSTRRPPPGDSFACRVRGWRHSAGARRLSRFVRSLSRLAARSPSGSVDDPPCDEPRGLTKGRDEVMDLNTDAPVITRDGGVLVRTAVVGGRSGRRPAGAAASRAGRIAACVAGEPQAHSRRWNGRIGVASG